ncbi:type I polyketide synthase [Amycolatopsis azurea]|uniref:Malonyl CoA-acyl carrier protein transacylase n=1 Tax=Amycolatopsis azurea DSM 43854 TaxID=1238180 RepID=M2PH31_9PSEU|nr:type I polyketide synthase [Amycolatopsis azurea]EMD23718.1 Malonyl CoA-acyl carrier protein transacylase [Amycolatopsis azurea DSM 43854]
MAVVGMAGRFPGANDPGELWSLIHKGVEAVTRLTEDEHDLPEALTMPGYVPVAGILEDIAGFDAKFFGIGPTEARAMDPQHRMLLECAWAALEDAGCVPDRFPGRIGVFGGVGTSTYGSLDPTPYIPSLDRPEDTARTIASEKDFSATRIAHSLDLTGPAVTVQTACSTSLVAAHLAIRALQVGDCDAALAGGCTVRVPQRVGYLYHVGGILAPDGHCRPFSRHAEGTVPGSGGGMVLLMRYDDAIAAGYHVRAVIRGSAFNNDGSSKVSFTAPASAGQTAVIAAALNDAGVEPSTINYLEAHGTGTELGDAVEFSAAERAYRGASPQSCALGSLKANIGHLDVGSGVAGLIKCVLALEHGVIPPAVNTHPSGADLLRPETPFYAPTESLPWPRSDSPRRAAVSSFGIGGTNAHIVLEESSPAAARPAPERNRLLVVSAQTGEALARRLSALEQVATDTPVDLLASTLSHGRATFAHRFSTVVRTAGEAREAFASARATHRAAPVPPELAFLLPGTGAEQDCAVGDLYRSEPIFRKELDHCLDTVEPPVRSRITTLLTGQTRPNGPVPVSVAMPALFALQWSLARLLDSWDIRPTRYLGHSLGEWVAACLAGTTDREHGMRLAALRGRLVESTPEGHMLSVPVPADQLRRWLPPSVSIATEIDTGRAVIAGPVADMEHVATQLSSRSVPYRPVPVNRAMHSAVLDPILDQWRDAVAATPLSPPHTPWLSNLTGTWITPAEAIDPDYWSRQLRETVLMDANLRSLGSSEATILVELGPGRTLSGWAARHPDIPENTVTVSALGRYDEPRGSHGTLMDVAGRLWSAGVPLDLASVVREAGFHRTPLPTYPFERVRHWITDVPQASPPIKTHREKPPEVRSLDPLAALWAEVLGTTGSDEDEDFFEAGGDSLLALRLSSAIQHTLGLHASPQDILASPTLRCLRTRLSGPDEQERSLHAFPLPPGATPNGPPLYLIHPIGGGTLVYRPLAAEIGSAHRVFGFSARGFRDVEEPRDDLNAMARAYTDELLDHLDDGPYWLAGSSFGGVVAVEMASLLTRSGKPPLLTALLDSPFPGSLAAAAPEPEAPPDPVHRRILDAHLRALTEHQIQLKPPPSPLVYIRAAVESPDEATRWRTRLTTLEVRTSPGDHYSMLEPPHVANVAAILSDCLTAAAHSSVSGDAER